MKSRLKRGLIMQSLCPLFMILLIRHFHCEYAKQIYCFFATFFETPNMAIKEAWNHEMLGELIVFGISLAWILLSLLYIPAFSNTQKSGFASSGEKMNRVEEKSDVAAIFLVTFIFPLLIADLSKPQYWISYLVVISLVCIVLDKSNLYYQSPLLAILKYRVYKFEVLNPDESKPEGFKSGKKYVGITKGIDLSDSTTIKWKKISDDVYLIYPE